MRCLTCGWGQKGNSRGGCGSEWPHLEATQNILHLRPDLGFCKYWAGFFVRCWSSLSSTVHYSFLKWFTHHNALFLAAAWLSGVPEGLGAGGADPAARAPPPPRRAPVCSPSAFRVPCIPGSASPHPLEGPCPPSSPELPSFARLRVAHCPHVTLPSSVTDSITVPTALEYTSTALNFRTTCPIVLGFA